MSIFNTARSVLKNLQAKSSRPRVSLFNLSQQQRNFSQGFGGAINSAIGPLSQGLQALDPYSRRLRAQADAQNLATRQRLLQEGARRKDNRLIQMAQRIGQQPTAQEQYASTLPTNRQVAISGAKTAGLALSGGLGAGGLGITGAFTAPFAAYEARKTGQPLSKVYGRQFGDVLPYGGLTRGVTTPFISKFAPQAALGSRVGQAGLNVLENTALNYGTGQPLLQGAGLAVASGFAGRPFVKNAPVSNFKMDQKTLDELVEAEQMIRFPNQYVGEISTGARTAKDAQKIIRERGKEIIDRIAGKYLPDKQLNTIKNPLSIAKTLFDLNRGNDLANVPVAGFNSQNKSAQAGLYDTYYHGTGAKTEDLVNKGIVADKSRTGAVSVTDNPEIAKRFGNVVEVKVPKNAQSRIADLTNGRVEAELVRKGFPTNKWYNKTITDTGARVQSLVGFTDLLPEQKTWLAKNGYIGVKIPSLEAGQAGNEIRFAGDIPKEWVKGSVAQQPLSVKTSVGPEDRKLLQSEASTTKVAKIPESQPELQPTAGGGAGTPSSPDIITDPIQKVIALLKEAKPMREQQEALYSAERARRVGAVAGAGANVPGEAGYYAQLSKLKGELPKVQFERIRNGLQQNDIDSLFNKVEAANITPFEKVTAKTGLAKLLGAEGGQVPVESEIKLLSEIFPPEFIEAVMAKRPFTQRLWGGIQGALNLPRALMATADLSAPLRQGIFFISRPKQFLPAFKEMFKYAFSEKAYQGGLEQIKAGPNYLKMREARLALTDAGADLTKREEAFMSTLPEKIPLLGAIPRGSNRAYSGFLTKLRADVFNDLVSKAESQGIKVQGKTLEDLGSFINSATGRGNLGKTMEKAAPILNGVFFSPRLMASRINLLNPATYVKYDPFVRKEALKSLLGFGATAGTVLGLASLGGAEVGKDPRSANFGKIQVGNTRYDILGGFQQYIRLASQLLSGQVVSSTTGKVITLGEGYKPLTRKDILMRFFEAKEAPVASFITALMTGQTGTGEPVNIPSEIISRFIPLMTQDIYDIAKDRDSVGQGLLMGLPGIFGVGSQTYGKSELAFGKNKIGQETAQIRPVQGLTEKAAEKAFGQRPLGSSSTYNIQTYIKELKAMDPETRNTTWQKIVQTNPDLAKKIKQVISDEKKGITVQDQTIKSMGVASGDRAQAVYKQITKLKTREEKIALWNDYVEKGIITKDVAKQLKILLAK